MQNRPIENLFLKKIGKTSVVLCWSFTMLFIFYGCYLSFSPHKFEFIPKSTPLLFVFAVLAVVFHYVGVAYEKQQKKK